VLVDRELRSRGLSSRLLLTVHDELIVEVRGGARVCVCVCVCVRSGVSEVVKKGGRRGALEIVLSHRRREGVASA
jgi:hypothetical protein